MCIALLVNILWVCGGHFQYAMTSTKTNHLCTPVALRPFKCTANRTLKSMALREGQTQSIPVDWYIDMLRLILDAFKGEQPNELLVSQWMDAAWTLYGKK